MSTDDRMNLVDGIRAGHPFFQGLPPEGCWVAAHRGGAGLWPENTLSAFEKALRLGVHMLEMDVRATADGVPVVVHDETVDRTTDGSGRVGDFTFRELRSLDAGHRWENGDQPGVAPWRSKGLVIPSLEEVFQSFPEARIVLEMKEARHGLVDSVSELIEEYGRSRLTLVASFHTCLLRRFRKRRPDTATSAGRFEVLLFRLAGERGFRRIFTPGYEALQVPERSRGIRLVTGGFVRAARREGLSVHVWTVNDPLDIRRFFGMGVEAVITDRPDIALEAAESMRT